MSAAGGAEASEPEKPIQVQLYDLDLLSWHDTWCEYHYGKYEEGQRCPCLEGDRSCSPWPSQPRVKWWCNVMSRREFRWPPEAEGSLVPMYLEGSNGE